MNNQPHTLRTAIELVAGAEALHESRRDAASLANLEAAKAVLRAVEGRKK